MEKWFDKEFEFNLPLEKFNEIISKLESTPARVEELISTLNTGILTRRLNNKWSIQENVGHLVDLEELHDARIDDFREGKKSLKPADLNNRKTLEANHNQKNINDLLNDLKKVRANFVKRLKKLNDEKPDAVSIHPRLSQPMRPIDMALFVAEHDDHHINTIKELIKKFSN